MQLDVNGFSKENIIVMDEFKFLEKS